MRIPASPEAGEPVTVASEEEAAVLYFRPHERGVMATVDGSHRSILCTVLGLPAAVAVCRAAAQVPM
jgi:hypothetical protein